MVPPEIIVLLSVFTGLLTLMASALNFAKSFTTEPGKVLKKL